ncbi:MAG: PAS domain S-box protein, partial [Acidobacteria bacterium]|nr:PAS domain S-box protein [Acidobacteriota bacterium]
MGDTLHVLLLDDNPDDWVLVRRQLSGEFPDFQMEPVTNTEGFTQALEVGGFDLVIADQQLSWNDGLAVLQAVKARWPHCPVIMLTIRASQEGLIESMKAGLDGYVLKSPKALMSLPAMVKAVRQRAELSRRRHALETYYKVVRTMNNSMRGTTEHPRAEEAVPRLPEQTGQLMAELDGPNYAAGLIGAAQLYEQVRQAETRYRDLYENAPDGYSAIDTNGVIREMNATQLNWLAYSREEVIGQVCYEDLLTPAGRRKFGHLLERCQREGHLENVELELVCKDGRLLPVRLNVVAMRDAEGRYLGCRATARDITKEKELEAQLLQAQKLESLGTLVGGIAHDFNNMLTA